MINFEKMHSTINLVHFIMKDLCVYVKDDLKNNEDYNLPFSYISTKQTKNIFSLGKLQNINELEELSLSNMSFYIPLEQIRRETLLERSIIF